MKTYIKIMFLLLITFPVSAQKVDDIIRDGLILTYYSNNNEIQKVEKYLYDNNYTFSTTNRQPYKLYKKIIDDKNYLAVYITSKGEDVTIGFSFESYEGNFFGSKVRQYLKAHKLFDYFEKEDIYVFVVPDPDVNGEVDYLSIIKVEANEIITFYSPRVLDKDYLWELYIEKLLKI
jgi:hypothetical protein